MSEAGIVTGEAIVYNSITRIGSLFDETIAPGAVTEFLRSDDVAQVALVRDHVPDALLARVKSGTLQLTDTASALRIRASIADTVRGRETIELMRRGDLYGMSFSFVTGPDGETWHEGTNGFPLRVIRNIKHLYDVSLVTWPAYPATSAQIERNDSNGRRMALARLQLAEAEDRGAEFERTLGEALYGKRIKPPAEVLRAAHKRRG